MKKTILNFAFVMGLSIQSQAQAPLQIGENQLNVGIGTSSWGLPLYVGLDHGIHEDISVGGELSYRNYNYSSHDYKTKISIVGILANGNYHFNRILNLPSQWNLYAGLNAGFYLWNYSSNDGSSLTFSENQGTGIRIGTQLGVRYFVNDTWGLHFEAGRGSTLSNGKLGATFKL